MIKTVDKPTDEQISKLRAIKANNAIRHRDFVEVFGHTYPLNMAVVRGLLPADLLTDAMFCLSSHDLFLARIEDMIQEFLDGLKGVLAPPKP